MLNISSEFKKVLEHYPELIGLIEQNKIKEFYDILIKWDKIVQIIVYKLFTFILMKNHLENCIKYM